MGGGGGRSQIMQGVFLHILADTLGSAILMQMFGWMIADPVCSIFIAVLIALSVGSLVADSMGILMQRSPKELDHSLPEAYQKMMQLEGVQGVHETHFWTLCTNYYCGGLKLEVSSNADAMYIVSHTQMIFRSINVTQLFVHLDFVEPSQSGHLNGYNAQFTSQSGAGNNLLLQNPGLNNLYYAPQQQAGHGHSH